jgi:glucoamylase
MRDIPVGNGSLLVNFDEFYQLRDIYFPHVGQENHTEGHPCRLGIWIDGKFSWIADEGWRRELRYLHETLVTEVRLVNDELRVELLCNDTVASHENIYLKRITATDTSGRDRQVKVFFHQDLRIYENNFGDTAMYDPETRGIIHYKKHRYFLINSDPPFASFATGRKAFQGHEGTWRDAEDGELSGGAMTEGSVDSTIGVHFHLAADCSFEFFYWIAAGTSPETVTALNKLVIDRTPDVYIDYTANYWRAWVNKNDADLTGLSDRVVELYKRSLLIVHTQIDHAGAILAANDYDVTERATDHYSYLWTRDGAFVANALDLAGFSHITRHFFEFCSNIVHRNGYFLQKYNPDGTVASGWHAAWDRETNEIITPIQEDETALVLWSLWEHYERYRDIEFAHRLYRSMTVPCAEFMLNFRDGVTGLPLPSWNLWEDRRGVHTFTCASVIAGLRAAANFANLFAESTRADRYSAAAEDVLAGMSEHLYSAEHGRFLRSLEVTPHGSQPDATVDASLFGLFYFACFAPDDERVVNTMNAVERYLTADGGIARFEHDGYMRGSGDFPGNIWFICTLWLAEFYIAAAKEPGDLDRALELIDWVTDRALSSGVLAEQLDPVLNKPVSVSPLTWSHSTFVATVMNYLTRLREMQHR